jgi:pyruvate dehydrogenase E2 component (dihydrolipoamide acetyltransferase)
MKRPFVAPELGEGIASGLVVKVLVAPGDRIAAEQAVVELETDKAVLEVPCPFAGTVTEVLVHEGEEAAVGATLLTVETSDGAMDAAVAAAPAEAGPTAPIPPTREAPATPAPSGDAPPAAASAPPRPVAPPSVPSAAPATVPAPMPSTTIPAPASPMVRRLAREIGVDIDQVTGSGPGGRITEEDVKARARAGGAAAPGIATAAALPDFTRWGEVERVPLTTIRRRTAERLGQAWVTIPHVTQVEQADITDLEALRKRYAARVEEAGGRLTLTAILLKGVATALQEHRDLNASIDMAAGEIVYKRYCHVGVAVDTERGLLVPVIRDVDAKNIEELALELGDLSERARLGKLTLEEMQGGTFTITNLGGIGGTAFTPIVNPPQVAILGVSRGRMTPVYDRDGVTLRPRLLLPLSLSYDHRAVDGAAAIRFLRRLAELLEQPFLLSLEG